MEELTCMNQRSGGGLIGIALIVLFDKVGSFPKVSRHVRNLQYRIF